MTNLFKIGFLLFFLMYDFGVIIPWSVSTNQIPLLVQLSVMLLHFIFYSIAFSLVFLELKKRYFKPLTKENNINNA